MEEEAFEGYLDSCLRDFLYLYRSFYGDDFARETSAKPVAEKFSDIVLRSRVGGRPVYLIIDEYDNFTNTMLRSEASRDYRAVTHGAGFYRSWFKKFKEACSRIFMTDVSPVTMDDQLFDYLRDAYHRVCAPNWIEWSHLASAFAYDGDWEPFLRRLARDYADTTPVRGGLHGEIRVQGYMQAEFGHLKFYLLAPEMELARGFCDFCLFPERVHYGDASHSHLIELKYAAKDASDEEMAEKVAEAKAQLAKYRADRSVPSLARGTTLHQVVYVFRGTALHVLEQVRCEQMA